MQGTCTKLHLDVSTSSTTEIRQSHACSVYNQRIGSQSHAYSSNQWKKEFQHWCTKQQWAKPSFHVLEPVENIHDHTGKCLTLFVKFHRLYSKKLHVCEMVRIERIRWPVNWPPTVSRMASWDLNELSYAWTRKRDMELTHGKCPVGENWRDWQWWQQLMVEKGNGSQRHTEEWWPWCWPTNWPGHLTPSPWIAP